MAIFISFYVLFLSHSGVSFLKDAYAAYCNDSFERVCMESHLCNITVYHAELSVVELGSCRNLSRASLL